MQQGSKHIKNILCQICQIKRGDERKSDTTVDWFRPCCGKDYIIYVKPNLSNCGRHLSVWEVRQTQDEYFYRHLRLWVVLRENSLITVKLPYKEMDVCSYVLEY
jgi:hypothetical protein